MRHCHSAKASEMSQSDNDAPSAGRPGLLSPTAALAGLLRTLARFPLPVGCALAWAVATSGAVHDFLPRNGFFGSESLQAILLPGFFLTLAVKLFAERQGWAALPQLALSVAGLALVALSVFTGPETFGSDTNPAYMALLPGFALLVTVAPFLPARQEDSALWDFNRASWLGAAFGLLVMVILGSGLAAAYMALDKLLGIDVPSDVYGVTWILSASVVWPLYALSRVPDRFEAPADGYCPRWVGFLTSYFLVPLVVLYLAILYAYMAKILVTRELPRGQVAYLVCGYAGFGVTTYLIGHPLRTSGNILVRLFQRYFFLALFAPVALLALAVGTRISDYGVTESRYLLVLLAVWMAGIALFYTLRAGRGLIAAALSLALMLIAASFGPLGAVGLSTYSQTSRLEALLTANGILADGRIMLNVAGVPREDLKRISSVVSYLQATRKLAAMEPWFADLELDFDQRPSAVDILGAMGQEYVGQWDNPKSFTFRNARNWTRENFDVRGFSVIARVTAASEPRAWQSDLQDPGSKEIYQLSLENGRFTVTDRQNARVSFDLNALAERLRATVGTGATDGTLPESEMTLEAGDGALRVRLHVDDLNGSFADSAPKAGRIEGWVLIGGGP